MAISSKDIRGTIKNTKVGFVPGGLNTPLYITSETSVRIMIRMYSVKRAGTPQFLEVKWATIRTIYGESTQVINNTIRKSELLLRPALSVKPREASVPASIKIRAALRRKLRV